MKYILLILLFACQTFGATYYVSFSDGADSDTGLTEALAWKYAPSMSSSTGVSAGTTFSAGDSLLFKRGDEWEVMGDPLNSVLSGTSAIQSVIGAYGTGDAPLFWGAALVGDASWSQVGGTAVYSQAFATKPRVALDDNGELFTFKKFDTDIATTALGAGEFTYDTDDEVSTFDIWVRMADDSDPDSATPNLRVATRDASAANWNPVYLIDSTYVTIQDIEVRGGFKVGMRITLTAGNSGNGNKIKDCAVKYCNGNGMDIINGSTSADDTQRDPIISGCTSTENGAAGISIGGNVTGKNLYDGIIENCTTIGCGWAVAHAGIYSASATNTIMRYNTATDQISFTNEGAGFMLDDSCIDGRVYENISGDNGGPGIITGSANVDAQIYNNIVYGCGKTATLNQNQGIRIGGASANTGANIYNNTVYDCQTGIAADKDAHTGYTITNNIISQSLDWDIAIFDGKGATVDYNCIYNTVAAGGTFMRLDTTTKNWADWLTDSGQSQNSVNADPKFINPTTDFHLGSNSPCLGIGRYNEEYPLGRNRYNRFGTRR